MTTINLPLVEEVLKVIIALAGLAGLIVSALAPEARQQSEDAAGARVVARRATKSKAGINKAYRRRQIVVLATLVVAAILSIALFLIFPRSDQQFYRYLQDRDPRIFTDSKSGAYFVARLFPDRSYLLGDSSLGSDIDRTNGTFDLYSNTAGFLLRTYNKQIEELVKRGGQVRILLSDWSEANKNLDYHATAVREMPEATREDILRSKRVLDEWIARFRNDPAVYRGKLEVRYTAALVLYTTWIRDKNTPDAAGHIEIQLHSGKESWPSVRFGKDSGPLVEDLAKEFQFLWNEAKESPL